MTAPATDLVVIVTNSGLENPHDLALYFSAILAVDKGIPSEVVEIENGWRVVIADEGKAADFLY